MKTEPLTDREHMRLAELRAGEQLCSTCMWWRSWEPPYWEGDGPPQALEWRGSCKCKPPTIGINDAGDGVWPATVWNDWCREYTKADSKQGDRKHYGSLTILRDDEEADQ